jgi:23S rRNA (cytosine1962-C5)-methyltransferase
MDRPYVKVTVTEKGERALRNRHPWVYGEEVTGADGAYENGGIVDVYSQKGRWLGAGFVNDASKIRVRIISRNANDRFDGAFWERRLRYAVDYRRAVMGDDFSCCRLVFGEADGLPGLTVDRFEDVLVAQCMCLGMEKLKDGLYLKLVDIMYELGIKISAVYERNDAALREKEGMEQGKGFALGSGDGHVLITENGIKYDVDYVNGQKTGFFLDQKYNRLAVAKLAKGRRVLDCFTHTGAFGLNCAAAGAEKVTSVDISAEALECAKRNAGLNGLDVEYVREDIFDLLTRMAEEKRRDYDLIILDPPAFTKSGATLKGAERGYKEINMKAMKLLPRGGYLATCSCSHFMTDELFRAMLRSAAMDADVSLRQIEARQQGPDHPVAWDVPETDYLKFYIFQVV